MENTYLEKFSEWLTIKGFTSNTVQGLNKTVKHFLNWIEPQNIEAENVSYNDVLAYINYKRKQGNKPRTLMLIVNALNHFYRFLQSEHQLNENPASNVQIKGIKRKVLQEILTPEELETIYKTFPTEIKIAAGRACPPQTNNELARRRNKIILGLIIYQGIRTEELAKLELQDLQLREGKINIQGGKRTEGRLLKLEAHQIYDLMDYVHTIRKQILEATKKESNKVFISVGTSLNFANMMQKLVKSIREQHKKTCGEQSRTIKDIKHIRTSVITNWLKIHNLRKVQYMAGHRYVSSTEAYQINNIDALHEDITRFHPL
ncbi:MAG: tyrosine-type recombinase/integrase [Bacteroidetes bacterium]|nr:tyrosine-type recombinase/integrase [Bacteroidota bacterium]MCA6445096.1 tyrosine-type recombinase/integrase [Bacteroidota bacterium]